MQDLELRSAPNFFNQFKLVSERRKKSIAAFDFTLDQCQKEIGTARQRLLINLRAAADGACEVWSQCVKILMRKSDAAGPFLADFG